MKGNRSFQDYIIESKRVEGWFDLDAARIINYINFLQNSQRISGNIFEIGVYHGKSALLLSTFIEIGRERLIVNDISFSDGLFLRNFQRFFPAGDFLTMIEKPSQLLKTEETTEECRIFSVDGGHGAEETYSDLRTAKAALHKRGIIILDDYFNCGYPGVSEGTCRFLSTNRDIVPWMYFFNKMALIRKRDISFYRNLMETHGFKAFCTKHRYSIGIARHFGNDEITFRKMSRVQSLAFRMYARLIKNKAVKALLRTLPKGMIGMFSRLKY